MFPIKTKTMIVFYLLIFASMHNLFNYINKVFSFSASKLSKASSAVHVLTHDEKVYSLNFDLASKYNTGIIYLKWESCNVFQLKKLLMETFFQSVPHATYPTI